MLTKLKNYLKKNNFNYFFYYLNKQVITMFFNN